MTAYLYRLPSGFAGMITRVDPSDTEPQIIDSTTPPTAFGIPIKMVNGKIQPLATGDAASVVYGFLVRPFPFQGQNIAPIVGSTTPPTSGTGDVLRRGYMSVKVNAGTAAFGGVVYARVAAPSGAKVIGGIEAAADGTNTVIVANAQFMSAPDASGNVEIAYNI
jgi:hypothetical protein